MNATDRRFWLRPTRCSIALSSYGELATDARRRIAAVRAGRCPNCSAQLTDPARSPGGYSHCFRCRIGWRVDPHSLRGEYLHNRPHPPKRQPASVEVDPDAL